jgi:hypothetical protein
MMPSIALGLVFACAFGAVGPMVARRATPMAATWLLSVGGMLSAASTLALLGLIGVTALGETGDVADQGHWSLTTLRHADPVHTPVAVAVAGLLVVSIVRLSRESARQSRARELAHRVCRSLDAAGDLVVIADEDIDAYAVPGRPGRVIVTTGMLRLLDHHETSAMLAHERAHLSRAHHAHRRAAQLAAAANPLLGPLTAAQEWATERWADEDAARTADRAVVASALGQVAQGQQALGQARSPAAARSLPRPSAAMAMAATSVDRRVAALLDGPPRWRPLLLSLAVGVLLVTAYGTLAAAVETAVVFHLAVMAYSAHVHLIAHRLPARLPGRLPGRTAGSVPTSVAA